jgi:hypothetical protein
LASLKSVSQEEVPVMKRGNNKLTRMLFICC